uniref:tRNA:m(4)X modification enzyme TRM13 n=1 Tax=Opuntia streptacantha TaxID=393608 RepID=A0A7C9CH15_OPUST
MENRCQFWLPKKKRFCANAPFNHSSFCGNHTARDSGNWVKCPIDPSHSVLEDNLEAHVKKCPLLKQAHNLSLQPYYQKGINRGRDESAQNGERKDQQEEEGDFSSEMKRQLVYNLTASQLCDLLCKIRTIHCSICKEIGISYKVPEVCNIWIQRQVDGKLPFQEKHVLQQASILGNLEDLGVLNDSDKVLAKEQSGHSGSHCSKNDIPAVVEFGAGRAYLTQILADCYGIKKVFLVERKSYKLKADRSLRQKESLVLERLRIDIEDLNLNAVESLRGVPYLAIGKHLCGPATDLTLRCCLAEHDDQDYGTERTVRQHLRGIAVATCCHHLSQWKHYPSKRYLLNLGITKDEFHALTWFTSWAVDADHGSELSDDSYSQSSVPLSDTNENGGDVEGAEGIIRNMKAVDRAAVGFMCKDIIDMGRFMWIKEQGLEAKLVKYVPSNISPENRLLIARQ